MSGILISCPTITVPEVTFVERWSEVREAEDLPSSLFTGHLVRFFASGKDWTAWYEAHGFRMVIRKVGDAVIVEEDHNQAKLARYGFSAQDRLLESIRFRGMPLLEGEKSIAMKWKNRAGIHFITAEQIGKDYMWLYFPDAFLISLTFVLDLKHLDQLADLFESWQVTAPFTVFGDVWTDHVSYHFRGSKIDAGGRGLTGELGPIQRPSTSCDAECPDPHQEWSPAVRRLKAIVGLTVVQREIGTLASDLLKADLIVNSPSSERSAVACYVPASGMVRNAAITSQDGSRQVFLSRLTSANAGNGLKGSRHGFRADLSRLKRSLERR